MFLFNRAMHQLAYWYCLAVWFVTKPLILIGVTWFESARNNQRYWSHALKTEILEDKASP